MSPDLLQTLVTFLVGGGLATGITQVFRAASSLKSGARATNRAVLEDAARARDSAEGRAEHQTQVAEYWRSVAGNYSYQLRAAGITPDPERPIPPAQAVANDARARRVLRRMEDSGELPKVRD